ncbi:MAG: arginine--tRNA ligase [Actinobacteria bacterium]|nr:MAG: arginine--tRNA ligase [Actinomycetota bacterium]
MIIEQLQALIKDGLKKANKEETLGLSISKYSIDLERPKEKTHGDWATNIALVASKEAKKAPRQLAEAIVRNLPESQYIKNVEIAGPGFINFFLTNEWFYQVLNKVEEADKDYGQLSIGKDQSVNIEFVSANPVGPLHIGHGRWAAVGDSLANILNKAGYEVTKEFYVNDFGRQIDLFAASLGVGEVPDDGYKGDYIEEYKRKIVDKHGEEILYDTEKLKKEAVNGQLEEIETTLKKFRVVFDVWTRESELYSSNKVSQAIFELEDKGLTYQKEGATWLKTSQFDDEKDRVIMRSNGEPTYFAADIAYHKDKIDQGFSRLIDIWGADHHGYIARVRASIEALGQDPNKLKIILGQLVRLYRGQEIVKMSKRTGEMVTFDELLEEVGKDAVRYIFLTKSTDTTLDFDIELAKEQSNKNPVYYVQYAHARICSILKHASGQAVSYKGIKKANLSLLKAETEFNLIRHIEQFEEVIQEAATNLTPHILTTYSAKLATAFHSFYTHCKVITDDKELTQARLALLNCAHITLRNVLELLGVSAPQKM